MLDDLKTALDAKGTYQTIVHVAKGIDVVYIIENEDKAYLDSIINNNIPEGFAIVTSTLINGLYKVNCSLI